MTARGKDMGVNRYSVEAMLSAIQASARDNIYIFTPELRYTFVSEGAAQVFGMTPEQMVGRTWDELIPPELTATQKKHVATVVATRQAFQEESTFPDEQGVRYYEYFLTPFLDERGAVELIVCISRDITDRKRAEQGRLEAERAAKARIETVARISDALVQAKLDLPAVLRVIADEVASTLGDACGISLMSEDGESLYSMAYRLREPQAHALYGEVFAHERFPKNEGFAGRILGARGPLLIPELSPEQVLQAVAPRYRSFFERFPLRSLLGVRLQVDGHVLGIISAARLTPGRPYVDEDVRMLEAIAQRASWAISNAQQYEALQAERQRLSRLQEVTAALAVAKTPEEVSHVALTHGLTALGAPRGGLWGLSKQQDALLLVGSRGYSGPSLQSFGRLALDSPIRSPAVEAFLRGEPIFIESEAEFEREYPELKARIPHIMRTFATACVPMVAERRSVGLLNFVFDKPRVFTPEDRAFLGIIARLCAQAIERTRLYEAEQAARAEAEAQRAYLHRLFEQLPAPVSVLTGRELVFTLSNPASQRMIGDRPLLGRTLLEALPELRGQGLFEVLVRVFDTGEPYVGLEVPVHYEQGPGEPRQGFFNLVYHPLYSARGQVEAIVSFAVDVTEQVLARRRVEESAAEREKALRQLEVERQRLAAVLQEAQAAARAKDEFLAMLGHELRNPLAPILTALQLMQLRAGDTLQKERALIERQLKHVVRLVDDLLDVSRITRGKIDLKKRPLELSEIVSKAVEMASPLLEERRHQLTSSVPSGLVVEGDEHRLTQIISNLLTNAAKYTEPGGHIEVLAGPGEGGVVLSVRDTGMGIGPELLPRVFELFVQGERTLDRAQGGLGLGLTIVKTLVELHGGRIRAESEGLGKGSTFTLWLPLSERDARQVHQAPASTVRAEDSRRLERRRILLVDDNRDAIEALAEGLEAFGYSVAVAFDGPGGLEAAARQSPELALLDIGLPVMDGYELARRLRELPGMSTVPLVAVTGYGQETDRRRTHEAGFQEHLVKPVDLWLLKGLLQQYLG
jgi:PAS domain S-box-containing protein